MTGRPPDEDRDAQRLAALLDALPDPEPSAALLRAVAEIPLRHPRPASPFGAVAWWPLRSASRIALSLVVIAALGALSGGLSAEDDAYEAADEWADLSALSMAVDLEQELTP